MKQQSASPFLRQRSFNRASQFRWREFAAHRDQITSRLEAAALSTVAERSLCVLGAGNCNDLDLGRLLTVWPNIQLADVDVEAMRAGVTNQLLTLPPSIDFTACDLTGALEHCHELSRLPTSESLTKLRRALGQLPAVTQLQKSFTAVASTCLLSQLIDIVRHTVGPTSAELPALAELVRTQHLRTLAELTAPGGTMLLFADFVSSDTLPDLLDAPSCALPALRDRVLREQGCFTGMDPAAICRELNEPPLASCWTEPATMSDLWRWNLGPRTYLVTSIVCRRNSEGL